METPSSTTRRITRSQAKALTNSNTNFSRKMEDSEKKNVTKSSQGKEKQERSALVDISNDSPIVGLASGSLIATPLSSVSKQKSKNLCNKTPGSGEALLRGQVKNLLQKVEEEAEISKFCLQSCGPLRHGFKAIFNSPAALVAPTPVNTPLVLNFSALDEFDGPLSSISESPIEDQLNLSQVINGIIDENKQAKTSSGTENDLISRTLFLEFSEKSESSSSDCSSVVTYQETTQVEIQSEEKTASIEEDDASIWSIQANASTRDDDEDEEDIQETVVDDDENGCDEEEYYVVGEEEDNIAELDELCEAISNISMDGEKKGKHTRFVYNSDDELVEECEFVHLKGVPTWTGKHVRFEDEDGKED